MDDKGGNSCGTRYGLRRWAEYICPKFVPRDLALRDSLGWSRVLRRQLAHHPDPVIDVLLLDRFRIVGRRQPKLYARQLKPARELALPAGQIHGPF